MSASQSPRLPTRVLSHEGSLYHTQTSITGALRAKPLPRSSWCRLSTLKSSHFWYDYTHKNTLNASLLLSPAHPALFFKVGRSLVKLGRAFPPQEFWVPAAHPGPLLHIRDTCCTSRPWAGPLVHMISRGRKDSMKTLWSPLTFYVYFPLRHPTELQRN